MGYLILVFAAASFLILSVSSAGNFPDVLSGKEERELFEKMKCGDTAAREKLILHNQRLVAHIVRKYYGTCQNSDDLVSIGTVGLIKAIDSYNVKNGARFATYAGKCIQNEILMYFRYAKKQSLEVSMSETIDTDKDGNPLTYTDIIKTDDTIADDIDKKDRTQKALWCIENVLTPREAKIIEMRYGLNGKKESTQREVSEKLDISRSYVSRIEKSALEKIRKYLE